MYPSVFNTPEKGIKPRQTPSPISVVVYGEELCNLQYNQVLSAFFHAHWKLFSQKCATS